jgi:hypothetical protein
MNFSLGARFGINNVLIPKSGPACIPASLDFTNAGEIEIDGEQVVSTGRIEYLQGVFIDNGSIAVPLTLTCGITGQRIICPANSQGYFNILSPNPPRLVATMAQGAGRIVKVFFYNVPIQANVWATA